MKVLVTGGAGFIGSALVRHIIRSTDASVINLDKLTYAAHLEALEECSANHRYVFELADVCDSGAVRRIFEAHNPDAVMHLAAESHVDRSIDGPSEFVRSNIIGTFTVLQEARRYYEALPIPKKKSFRVHHISTDEVYGELTSTEPAFTEQSRYSPNSPYSASKAASDHLVRAWGKTFKLPIIISNCSNNYGPWQAPEKLIPVVISKCFFQQPIPVYGTGKNIRDWLYVIDHAEALWQVLKNGRLGETYNIGGNEERSNISVVRAICTIMDERFPEAGPHARLITFVNDRPGHDFRYAINAQKMNLELGWHPKHSFDAAIVETVDWYLANDAWWRSELEHAS